MSIISKVTNGAKNILNEGLVYKTIGAATLVTVAYDSHKCGKTKAINTDYVDSADRYDKNYKQYMTLHKSSPAIANMKNWWFGIQQTFTFHHVISKTEGYIKGASRTVLGNLPEIALSILALRYRKNPIPGKISAGLLTLNAAKTVIYDVIGIGAK